MDYSEFKRESIVRHQSERLLDRNLISFERKQPLHEIERTIQKKVLKKEEEKKAQEEALAKVKNLDIKPYEALDKIIKHFNNPKKCSKALVLYKDLLIKSMDTLEPDHVFYSLYEVMKNFHLMASKEDKENINTIFRLIEGKKGKILYKESFKDIFEIWRYEGFVHLQIFTDDSYQFNDAIKKLKQLAEDLEIPDEDIPDKPSETPVEKEKPETQKDVVSSIRSKLQKNPVPEASGDSKVDVGLIRQKLTKKKEENVIPEVEPPKPKYEYTIPPECLEDITSKSGKRQWKRKILFEITKDVYGMYKFTWAKTAIKQYFDQIYIQRDVFNEEQKKGIEDFKAGLSNLKGADIVKDFKRGTLDSQILSNPLVSSNEVKDARSTTFAYDGLGKWAGRQSGI